MIVLKIIAAMWVGAIALMWCAGAVRTWRGVGRLSEYAFFRVQPQRRKDNIDRCAAPAAASGVFLFAIIVESMFFGTSTSQTPTIIRAATAYSFLGLLVSTLLGLSILWFKFPKHAIAPQLWRPRAGTASGKGRGKSGK